MNCSPKPPPPPGHNKIGGQDALSGLWMKQRARMRWSCSVCVCLHVLLSINLLFRRVVLCTALRVDVDGLMGMAEIPSNSFIHSSLPTLHGHQRVGNEANWRQQL